MFSGIFRKSKFFVGFLFFVGCNSTPAPPKWQIPLGFPPVPVPPQNPLSKEKIELGEKLFFDKNLSRNGMLSCADCHRPETGYTNGEKNAGIFSENAPPRNVPSLFNLAYYPYFFAEGGVRTLEEQALAPIGHSGEMQKGLDEVMRYLNSAPDYVQLFQNAFEDTAKPEYFVKALSSYERTIFSTQSRWDEFAQGDSTALTALEKKGMQLFFSERTGCSNCHNGFLMTNFQFKNIGLYEQYADPGRMRLTGNESDLGKFKTPSLRNIAQTAPYMHDGSFPDLESVIEHYNSGGKNHPNKDERIRPLYLSQKEKAALAAFLKSL